MRFCPTKKLTCDRDVKIKLPDGSEVKVTVTMEMLNSDETAEFFNRLTTPPARPDGMPDDEWAKVWGDYSKRAANSKAEFLRRTIVGWPSKSGIADENDNDTPFSAEALNSCLAHPFFVNAAFSAYSEAVSGGGK